MKPKIIIKVGKTIEDDKIVPDYAVFIRYDREFDPEKSYRSSSCISVFETEKEARDFAEELRDLEVENG